MRNLTDWLLTRWKGSHFALNLEPQNPNLKIPEPHNLEKQAPVAVSIPLSADQEVHPNPNLVGHNAFTDQS